jgi:hypothetical protein
VGNNDNEGGLTAVMMGGKSGAGGLGGLGGRGGEGSSGCGASTAAAARLKQGVPAWVYRYDGEYENTKISPNPGVGAYHR